MGSRIAAIAAACVFAMFVTTGPALAHSGNQSGGHHGHNPYPPPATEVASQLISPLKVAFGPHGNYLVAEAFAGQLRSISPPGAKTVVVSAPGQEIAGVSYGFGTTYYFNNDQRRRS
ncbi:hypothetical protein [Arthrobacter alpinus]|nr:hypothetical protein [Arthrobacter alpinus]